MITDDTMEKRTVTLARRNLPSAARKRPANLEGKLQDRIDSILEKGYLTLERSVHKVLEPVSPPGTVDGGGRKIKAGTPT